MVLLPETLGEVGQVFETNGIGDLTHIALPPAQHPGGTFQTKALDEF